VCEKRFIIICFIKKNGAKTTRKASPQTKFRFLFFFSPKNTQRHTRTGAKLRRLSFGWKRNDTHQFFQFLSLTSI